MCGGVEYLAYLLVYTTSLHTVKPCQAPSLRVVVSVMTSTGVK